MDTKDVLFKMRERYPETPEDVYHRREKEYGELRAQTHLFLTRQRQEKSQGERLLKAHEARSAKSKEKNNGV